MKQILQRSEDNERGWEGAAEDPQQLFSQLHRQGARPGSHGEEAVRGKRQADQEVQEGKSRGGHTGHLRSGTESLYSINLYYLIYFLNILLK